MPAKSPARSYTYDFTTGMLTGEDDPDGSKEFWTYQTDTLTIDSQSDTYVVPTATGEGIDSLSSDGILPVNLAISFSYGGDTYTYAPNMSTAADSVVYSAIGDYAGEYGNSSGDYLVANLTDGGNHRLDLLRLQHERRQRRGHGRRQPPGGLVGLDATDGGLLLRLLLRRR